MLKTRKAYIHKARSISDSQTLDEDIKVKDPISAILITYQVTNGATSNQGGYPHKDVDTIRVADGSDMLFSMDGIQTQAQARLGTGKMPYMELDESAAGTMREQFPIYFGRWIGDPLYWLDPKEFSSLMLTLEHSLTVSATAGIATGTGLVTAEAIVFKDRPPMHEGFLMCKSQHKWATAASGEEPINLPKDFPYRNIGLRAFETTVGFHESLTNVKISCDGDSFIPIDIVPLDLVRENAAILGQAEVEIKSLRTDADVVPMLLGYIKYAHCNARLDLNFSSLDAIDDDAVTINCISVTNVPAIAKEADDVANDLFAKGDAYHNAVGIYFGDKDDPLDFFPANLYDSIEAKITQGNAAAAASVWVQQIRK